MFCPKKSLLYAIVLLLLAGSCSFPKPEEARLDLIRVYQTPLKLTGEEALAAINREALTAAPPQYNQGLSGDYFWVIVNLENFQNIGQAEYLEIKNAHIDTAACYLIRDSSLVFLGMSGDHIPFDQREIKVLNMVFPLPVLQPRDRLLLMVDKQKGNNSFPLQFLNRSQLAYQGVRNAFLYAIFFGALCLTFVISLTYGIVNRRKDTFFYSFFALFSLGFHLTNTGYGFALIYPNYPGLSTPVRIFFVFFNMASLLLFEYYFLEMHKAGTVKRIHRVIMGIMFVLMAFFLSSIPLLYRHGLAFIQFYFFLNTVINSWALIAALLMINRTRLRAYAFLAGHTGNMVGYFLGVVKDTKLLPVSSFWMDSFIAGTSFELLVFNVGLIVSIRHINHERKALAQSLQTASERMEKIKAKNKLLESQTQFQQLQTPQEGNKVKASANPFEQLAYVRVEEHYLHLYSFPTDTGQRTTIREPLKSFMQRLPEHQFIQTHRSYLVNRAFVQTIGANHILLKDGKEIPMSRTYRSRWIGLNDPS